VPTYLYVIASSPEGPVKLGRSADPKRRVRQLQTGHSETLRLYLSEEVSAAEVNAMERAVHKTIGYKRLRGEWFDITVEEAIEEVRHAICFHSGNLEPKTAASRLEEFRGLI
jgi:hypothetical protein